MLMQIAVCSQSEAGDAAHQRLFPRPTERPDRRLEADWKMYVEPDLQEAFKSATDLVEADLASMSEEQEYGGRSVCIPIKNLWTWVNALNQARLALAARYSIGEADMYELPEISDGKGVAIFQIGFYGTLQECFLQVLEEAKE